MPRPKKPAAKGARERVPATLPRELLEQIDAIAADEDRHRSKVIEIACRMLVQSYQQRPATDPLAKHLAPPTARERAVRGGKVA